MGYLGNTPKSVKSITTINASTGQQNFTVVGGYISAEVVDIYQNGVKLVYNNDYTLPGSGVVSFTVPASENDIIEIVIFSVDATTLASYSKNESDARFSSTSKIFANTLLFG